MVDAKGIPLALRLSGANRHDSMLFEEMLDAIEPIKQRRGRPRKPEVDGARLRRALDPTLHH